MISDEWMMETSDLVNMNDEKSYPKKYDKMGSSVQQLLYSFVKVMKPLKKKSSSMYFQRQSSLR